MSGSKLGRCVKFRTSSSATRFCSYLGTSVPTLPRSPEWGRYSVLPQSVLKSRALSAARIMLQIRCQSWRMLSDRFCFAWGRCGGTMVRALFVASRLYGNVYWRAAALDIFVLSLDLAIETKWILGIGRITVMRSRQTSLSDCNLQSSQVTHTYLNLSFAC